ncbi:MAG TPA: 3-oxoacyl-[acyl-carrier-protein] synthase III C-terminal domain-containing protein [Thermoanaerobaculia bacterium]|nr:3-oxoacyl-[acyl-carrier-protein] synthase III C-terminal domain-containing protein [Thermoanaerobaculia bacterium]
MNSIITGTGIGLPSNIVPNEKLARIMDTSDEWIRTRSGIETRYYTDPGETSASLGTAAARQALEKAGRKPEEIDAVVFATMTPDYFIPGNGPLLQRDLGLRAIPTFDIRQQCSGFLYGLELADSLIRGGKYKKVLLIGSEVHTPFMPWSLGWDTTIGRSDREVTEEERAINTKLRDRIVLFGDGAGAAVLEANDDPKRGFLHSRLYTDGSAWKCLSQTGAGFSNRPFVTHEQIDAFETVPVMEGREVFRQAVTLMPQAVRDVVSEAGLTLDDIDLLLIHQANLRIIEGVQKQLGFNAARVPHNIERYGNTTAATLAILLHECMEAGKITEGSLIAFTALGSGLHWGAAVYRH